MARWRSRPMMPLSTTRRVIFAIVRWSGLLWQDTDCVSRIIEDGQLRPREPVVVISRCRGQECISHAGRLLSRRRLAKTPKMRSTNGTPGVSEFRCTGRPFTIRKQTAAGGKTATQATGCLELSGTRAGHEVPSVSCALYMREHAASCRWPLD
jgi:hypothetical protein